MAFQLLALAIERASGKPYGDVLQDAILSKLNLTSTTLGQPSSGIENVHRVGLYGSNDAAFRGQDSW